MSDYCDIPEFFSANWPVARKQHKCCECYAPILQGERYGVFTGKWDGDMSTFKQHIECEDACRWVRDKLWNDGECLAFGELLEYLGEYGGLDKKDPEQQAMRTLTAKVKWRHYKKRPLTFITTRPVVNKSLEEARKRGWA